jgi:hypothetical protein
MPKISKKKHTDKIWVYNGKIYNSEVDFMKACVDSGYRKELNVSIYQLVETHNAVEHKNHITTSRERDDRLSLLLGDDRSDEIVNMNKFKELLTQYKPADPKDWYNSTNDILKILNDNGLSYATFKKIANNYREWLLYNVSNDLLWYESLLKCYNFTGLLPVRIKSKWDNALYKSVNYEIPTPQEALDNFKQAKINVKKGGLMAKTTK